jgi:cell division protein FtsL
MQNKDTLIIAVFTLITVLAWIVFDVYHVAVTSTITEVQQKLLTPLDPKISDQVLSNIRSRTYR